MPKIKLFILTGTIGITSLVGMTYAENLVCNNFEEFDDSYGYEVWYGRCGKNPVYFGTNNVNELNIRNIPENIQIYRDTDESGESYLMCENNPNNGGTYCDKVGNFDLETFSYVRVYCMDFDGNPEERCLNVNMSIGTSLQPDEGGGDTGGDTGGGDTGGDTGGGIVSGGINAFSGIIEKLGNILGEFGPYILYIAIACIGISLLFKALKSLLGFTDNKAKNSIGGRPGMKDRRRRRRRNRRFKRAIYKNETQKN